MVNRKPWYDKMPIHLLAVLVVFTLFSFMIMGIPMINSVKI